MQYLYARTRNALGKIAKYGNARRDHIVCARELS